MKKITTLILTTVILISCSSESELEKAVNDPIVAKFTLQTLTVDGDGVNLTSCQMKNSWEFFALNVGESILYEPTECTIASDQALTWAKSGGAYTVTSNKPFLEGSGIPSKSAKATVGNSQISATFTYDGQEFKLTYRK